MGSMSAAAIVLNIMASGFPIVAAVMTVTAVKLAMRAYSIAVEPDSIWVKRARSIPMDCSLCRKSH